MVKEDDVYGDGVNVAARLEGMAGPGSVLVSRTVFNHAKGKVRANFEDLGEQELKNIAEPVRVFRVSIGSEVAETPTVAKVTSQFRRLPAIAAIVVLLVAGAGATLLLKPWEQREKPASVANMAFPLPNKPSIAVLPFTNMSDDPEQEYFADGMTDDLITDLSKISGLFVIARNSSFAYKGKPVEIRKVAEDLGVRYVLEGSVRRSGGQVRVNAQLIDATTGGHLWADRYDQTMEDIFSLQDQVTNKIVAALAVNLTADEHAKQARQEIDNPQAYDAFLQGWERYLRHTAEDYVKAVSHFENAIERAPAYDRAYSALAAVYWDSAWNGWTRALGISYQEALKRTRNYLTKGMEEPSPLAYQIASELSAWELRADEAVAHAERAIALDPNDPSGFYALANALIYAKRPEESVKAITMAMRLNPHYPPSYLTRLARAQFALEQFGEAVETLKRATKRNPEDEWPFVFLAASYGHLGHEQEAYSAIEAFNTLRADNGWAPLTLNSLFHWRFKERALREPLHEGLRKAELSPGDVPPDLIELSPSGFSIEGAITVDVVAAKALHDRGVPFVDVRGDQSWQAGHVSGAVHLKLLDEFSEANLSTIVGKGEEVVFYSRAPMCGLAPNASAKAKTWGYSKIYYLRDGFQYWENAGYPTAVP
jgi:TolB-like protein/rhodanese-related sulfurtransferase